MRKFAEWFRKDFPKKNLYWFHVKQTTIENQKTAADGMDMSVSGLLFYGKDFIFSAAGKAM